MTPELRGGSAGDLAYCEVKRLLLRGDLPLGVRLGEERRLAEASRNEELVGMLRHVAERIRPVRTHDFIVPGRIDATIAQHLGILDALLLGTGDPAALLIAHIEESREVVEAAVGAVLERMLAQAGGDA